MIGRHVANRKIDVKDLYNARSDDSEEVKALREELCIVCSYPFLSVSELECAEWGCGVLSGAEWC